MGEDIAILRELKRISKILLLSNGEALERDLSKILTTKERRKMWMLTDGKRMPKEIASLAGVTQMAVSNFLATTVSAGLMEYVRGKPPTRLLDYVPADWIDLTKVPIESSTDNDHEGVEEQ